MRARIWTIAAALMAASSTAPPTPSCETSWSSISIAAGEAGWVVFDVQGPRAVLVGEVPPGEVAGNGTVVVTSWDCGVTTKTTFALGRAGFVARRRAHTGKRDPSKCAG